jgi:hypothetical protein
LRSILSRRLAFIEAWRFATSDLRREDIDFSSRIIALDKVLTLVCADWITSWPL